MVIVKVYSKDGLIPLQVEDDKCYCTHKYDGSDTLSFEVQRKDGNHKYIKEEVIVECFNNRFIIKKIDEHSDFSSIACELDLDDWKYDIYKNYRKTRYTIVNAVDSIIPDGWSAVYSDAVNVTKRTTLEESDGQAFRIATALEILAKAAETYEVVFNYDCIGKILYVENPSSFTSSGDYFMEDLNISITGFNGDSSGFATRVYAYGNQDDDGNFVTFADINNGKEYIEDFTYSDKIISTYIIDERYTVKEHLLEYAKSVLKEKSVPSRSYQCENIKNIDGTMYLYKVVTLIDKDRRMQVEHQCVQYIEYNNHNLDSITLSMTQPQITSSIQSANSTASKAQSTANSVSGTVSEIKTVVDELPDIYVTKFELEEVVDELDGSKQEKLTPGENITIDEDNVISAVSGGSNYGLGIDNENLYLIEDGISDSIPLATEEMIDNIPINGNCINTPMIYSTDEKKVGVWIDGKSIYQKTIHISSFPSGAGLMTIDPQVNNLYEIIDFNGYCAPKDKVTFNTSYTRSLPFVSSPSDGNSIRIDSTYGLIRLFTYSNWSNYEGWLTIRYTKTTD